MSVRAEARVVGMRVLCRAAAERAREEAAARQRRQLNAQLLAIAEAGRAPIGNLESAYNCSAEPMIPADCWWLEA